MVFFSRLKYSLRSDSSIISQYRFIENPLIAVNAWANIKERLSNDAIHSHPENRTLKGTKENLKTMCIPTKNNKWVRFVLDDKLFSYLSYFFGMVRSMSKNVSLILSRHHEGNISELTTVNVRIEFAISRQCKSFELQAVYWIVLRCMKFKCIKLKKCIGYQLLKSSIGTKR